METVETLELEIKKLTSQSAMSRPMARKYVTAAQPPAEPQASREFAAESDYEYFLERVLERSNQGRREQLAVMTALPPTRLT